MKIIHVINDLSGGGAEKLVYEFASFQHKEGHDVVVILLMPSCNNIYDRYLVNSGVKVIYLNAKKYSLKTILKLRRSLKTIMPDIIHSHLFPSLYYVVLATLGLNIKLVTTEHSTSNFRLRNKVFKLFEKFIYSYYDTVVAISNGVKDVYLTYLPGFRQKIIKIENGIDLKLFKNYNLNKAYLGIQENKFIITMVARFSSAKDQNTLVRSLVLLPESICLVLVGIGVKLDSCKKLAEELQLSHRIKFLGFRTDVPEILSISDVVVLSSFWEGFGLSAVEGMASGKPVIATDIEGLKDIVKDFGCLFEVGDYLALSKYILKLFRDVDYYNLVSTRCKLRARDFDISLTNSSYISLYKRICKF